MSDFQAVGKQIAKIFRKNGLSYQQTKKVVAYARRECGLKAPSQRKGVVERLTRSEEERFINEAYRIDGRRGLMQRTLLETGLRVSEFIALQVEDISFEERLIIVRAGKGGKQREVPITRSLARELRLYVGMRNTGPVFQSPRGGQYSARRVQQMVAETAEAAEIKKRVYPHLLRQTIATRLHNAGMSIELVQKMLGHERLDTTRIYAQSETATMRKGFDLAMQKRENV